MLKEDARSLYREKRKSLSPAQRSRLDDLMLIQFQTVDLPFIHSLLTYWPIEENNEPNTHLFTDYLEFKNPSLKIFYPRSNFSTYTMDAVEVGADTSFKIKEHGIHEPVSGEIADPASLELIIVPMLICDTKGYRVGYGKGFYDKYLAACSESCLKIGFSYFEPIEEIEGRHGFDLPLDICITPQSVYVFDLS